MSHLLIVESPGKVINIASILGDGWNIMASLGHVRDLPDDELGIEIPNRFFPRYRILKSHSGIVKRLRKAAHAADAIYLATDPDREGEAIAWHILQLLKGEAKDKPVHRVTFTSITEKAVRDAIAAPRRLDMDLVEAQQARRVVDRLVGYLISPLACKSMNKRVSAGRVQSVCLRLVVDREREIAAFAPTKYWTLDARLRTGEQDFTARLTTIQGKKIELSHRVQIDRLIGGMTGKHFWVNDVEQVETARRPLPPFTTSSLLEAASKALRLSPEQTMTVAQTLYEAGHITYMRTDSVAITSEPQAEALAYIGATFGQSYIPALPQVYETKTPNSQEAHDAIRPTHVAKSSGDLQQGDGAALYDLIWKRFVASQMANATYVRVRASIQCGERLGQAYPLEFEATGRTLLFDGFLKVYEEALDEGEEIERDVPLPSLSPRLPLTLTEWDAQEHTTKAPARYTEAALIRGLEQRGLGRPSTYANMVRAIKDKGYVHIRSKRLVPTDTGLALCDFLVQRFPIVMSYDYTASLEADLDQIAAKKADRLSVVQTFWNDKFSKPLQSLAEEVASNAAPDDKSYKPPRVVGKCPKCGGDLVERRSGKGTFAGCVNFPKCTGTAQPVRLTTAKKGKVKS